MSSAITSCCSAARPVGRGRRIAAQAAGGPRAETIALWPAPSICWPVSCGLRFGPGPGRVFGALWGVRAVDVPATSLQEISMIEIGTAKVVNPVEQAGLQALTGDRTARQIMKPRIDIDAATSDATRRITGVISWGF